MKVSLSILVVEDEPELRQIAQIRLVHSGHQVTCVENGAEAVELCITKGQHFDIVLMDLRMPVMDGFECIRRLHEDDRTRDLPILVISGEGATAATTGEAYLIKPYSKQQLFQGMTEVLLKYHRINPGDSLN